MTNFYGKIFTFENDKLKSLIITEEEVKDAGCGVETFFLPVSSRRGLKIFDSRQNAMNSLRRQKKAATKGLAPKVMSEKVFKVIIPLGFERMFSTTSNLRKDLCEMFENEVGYGYYTQKIKMVKSRYDYTTEEEVGLENALLKLFPYDSLDDIHYGNVGRIKGKLVMVDFGDVSAS